MNNINHQIRPLESNERQDRLAALEARVGLEWANVKKTSVFFQLVFNERLTVDLYSLYMTQTYHYTKHNARNQALVGVTGRGISAGYMKFCFHHAAEETGHEMMAIKDLQSVGVNPQSAMNSLMLMETEALVAYLYWISAVGNPLQRLGYSFWAENSYRYIGEVLAKVKADLDLQPRQMTFFIAHSEIDAEHAEEVQRELLLNCRTDADWQAIEQVMVRSLRLTVGMMDAVAVEYRRQNSLG